MTTWLSEKRLKPSHHHLQAARYGSLIFPHQQLRNRQGLLPVDFSSFLFLLRSGSRKVRSVISLAEVLSDLFPEAGNLSLWLLDERSLAKGS